MAFIHGLYAGAALAAVAALPARAQDALPTPLPQIAAQTVTEPPARPAKVFFPGGVTQMPGLTYGSTAGFRPVTLDLYLPPSSMAPPAAGFPLVIYIHGGAWMVGISQQSGAFVDFPGVLASLAARGYVVAALNYRLSGEARWPAQPTDVGTAIRWLRGHAADYRIDPANGLVWGVSAGGHLTGLAAMAPGAAGMAEPVKGDPHADVSTVMQAAVSWYGVFDISTIAAQAKLTPGSPDHDAPDAAEWKMLGCVDTACPPGLIAKASPVTYVSPKSPPMLLVAGTDDHTVPYQQSVEMADALKKAGVRQQLITIPGVDHGLIGKTQAETQAASLKALAATFAFIDSTIGAR